MSIHNVQCNHCIQNTKHISIFEESKQSVSESLAMKLFSMDKWFFLIYCKSLLNSNSCVPFKNEQQSLFLGWKHSIRLLPSTPFIYQQGQVLDERPGLVLCGHHDGHPSHPGDVGSCDCGGGQWRWRGGSLVPKLRLAVGLRQRLRLG